MANPITTVNGTHEFEVAHAQPWSEVAVIPHGDANDFTWELQISLTDGSTWQTVAIDPTTPGTGAGAGTSHLGATAVEFLPVANARFRVKVTSMGTATSIIFATS